MIDPTARRIVCDTGPLISLEKLRGGYQFIRRLFDQLIVPPAVLDELSENLYASAEAYLQEHNLHDLLVVEGRTLALSRETQHLDLGERQAIALAIELNLPLLIEEEAGRAVARDLGIEISGIAGQLFRAVRQQFLSSEEALAHLARLRESGRINRQIYAAVRDAIEDEV